MATREELTLTVHGLGEFRHAVDAEVFAFKFQAFIKGLAASDQAVNAGDRKNKYLIEDLRKNTATALVREQALEAVVTVSGAAFFRDGLVAVAEGRPSAIALPERLIKEIAKLGKDVGKSFSHAEIKHGDSVVAKIDQDFADKAARLVIQKANDNLARAKMFKGMVFGSFDGVLELIDIREGLRKAILTLTAGALAIDCDVRSIDMGKLRDALGVRSTVDGVAHYDGIRPLPQKLEVRDVTPMKPQPDLARWRGAFNILDVSDPEDDWG